MFADEMTSVAGKEMMDIVLSCYNAEDQEFGMEYLALLEIPSTKSPVLLDKPLAIFRY